MNTYDILEVFDLIDIKKLEFINQMSSFVVKNKNELNENIKKWCENLIKDNLKHITFWDTTNIKDMNNIKGEEFVFSMMLNSIIIIKKYN